MPETPETQTREQRSAQAFPVLTDEQMAAAARYGAARRYRAGEVLFDEGDLEHGFAAVVRGRLQTLRDALGKETVVSEHGPGSFIGEVGSLSGQGALAAVRAAEDTEAIWLEREQLQDLVSEEAELGELLMRAFILRRMILIEELGGPILIGAGDDRDTHRLREVMVRNALPHVWLDPEANPAEADAVLRRWDLSRSDLPVVVGHGGADVLRNPGNAELAQCLGLGTTALSRDIYDTAVVGAGPAGLAAAVYAASEGLSVVVLDRVAPGGQAGTSSRIENYLGFPTGISGQALAGRAFAQAQKFGADIAIPVRVTRLDCARGRDAPHRLHLEDGAELAARTVVIATGAIYRRPDIPGLGRFEGQGVYYGATALEAKLCSDQAVIVVGGGNSAGQAAVFLSQRTRCVHLLVRDEDLSATMSSYLVRRIEEGDRITLHRRTEIVRLDGEGHLERVTWIEHASGQTQTLPIRAVFMMIGATPNTEWLGGSVALDGKGFVRTGADLAGDGSAGAAHRPAHPFETSCPGVFAVGDVRLGSVKRVAAAVGEGSACVQFLHKVLAEEEAGLAGSAAASAAA